MTKECVTCNQSVSSDAAACKGTGCLNPKHADFHLDRGHEVRTVNTAS